MKDINEEILDISLFGTPDFADFNLQYYPQAALYTSRSCPFQCNFCVETVYWGKYRKKRSKQIVKEMKELYKKHNNRLFLMCDSLLNPVIDDLTEEVSNEGISVYWGGYLRVDKNVCNIDNTTRWRQSGFYRARLGIESGSQKILELMNKKINLNQVKIAVSSLAFAGIKTTVMFVIGYPGETEDDFIKTLELIDELKDDIYEADCNPFWYFYNGQVNSNIWGKKNKRILLYPETASEMLMLQTWILDCEPSRQTTYNRVNRFIVHCGKLKIPNPYTLYDTNKADIRWKKLHKNAVPSLLEFKSSNIRIGESRHVKMLSFADDILNDEGNWGF